MIRGYVMQAQLVTGQWFDCDGFHFIIPEPHRYIITWVDEQFKIHSEIMDSIPQFERIAHNAGLKVELKDTTVTISWSQL